MGNKAKEPAIFAISSTGDDGDFLECRTDITQQIKQFNQMNSRISVGGKPLPDMNDNDEQTYCFTWGLKTILKPLMFIAGFNAVLVSFAYLPTWVAVLLMTLMIAGVWKSTPDGAIYYFLNGGAKENDKNTQQGNKDKVDRLKIINGSDLDKISIPPAIHNALLEVATATHPSQGNKKAHYLVLISLIAAGLQDPKMNTVIASMLEKIMFLHEDPIVGVQFIVDSSVHSVLKNIADQET